MSTGGHTYIFLQLEAYFVSICRTIIAIYPPKHWINMSMHGKKCTLVYRQTHIHFLQLKAYFVGICRIIIAITLTCDLQIFEFITRMGQRHSLCPNQSVSDQGTSCQLNLSCSHRQQVKITAQQSWISCIKNQPQCFPWI